MQVLRTLGLVSLSAAVALAAGNASALSSTFGFGNVTNTSPNVAAQFFVDVSDVGGPGTVTFTFRNVGPIASSITEIYFDDGTLLGIPTITNGSGTSFVHHDPLSPPNLPGGSSLIPKFVATDDFGAETDPEKPANGVNPGESVTLLYTLIGGNTFADTIAAIQLGMTDRSAPGSLSIGLHVRAIAGGSSDGFVTVPEPTGALLFGIGSLLAGAAIRRRS